MAPDRAAAVAVEAACGGGSSSGDRAPACAGSAPACEPAAAPPADAGSTLDAWRRQGYPEPDEPSEEGPDAAASLASLKHAYRPPRSDAAGIAIALAIIGTWAALFYHGCWQVVLVPREGQQRSHWLDIAATFVLLEFANTGLFITAHDAMHGTIAYRRRRLNDLLGRVAISLYAYFDYAVLHKKHWQHHNHTGTQRDPDFHRGNTNVLVWFGRFMWEYLTLLQVAKIVLASQVLQAAGVPYANLCLYMAGAPLLAAVRLFVFGTYLPHLPPDATTPMPWQRSHSSDVPAWASFLICYHFSLHLEHHMFPYAPWWHLPRAKAITRQAAAASAHRA